MEFLRSMIVAASGLRAQNSRMRIIAENIANADSTSNAPGGDPYRRQIPAFETEFNREMGVDVVVPARTLQDRSDFRIRFDPGHPAADERGYVKLPNVSTLVESMDMRDAQRSYQANLNIISSARRMVSQTLEILRA